MIAIAFTYASVIHVRMLAKSSHELTLFDLTRVGAIPIVLGIASAISIIVMLRIRRGFNVGPIRFAPLLLACLALPIQRLASSFVAWLA